MSSFDAAFDTAFDSTPAVLPLATGVASFPAAISVVSPLVFSTGAGYIRWAATVLVGGVDVSSRLTGRIMIAAAESSPRVASFFVRPDSAAELAAYDSALVTIDVALFRTGQHASFRRFTGRVETVEFSPAERIAALSCRDGYNERPAACASAEEVESLFGGLATPCAKLVPWSDEEPDPQAYFEALLDTLPGFVALDASGVWRAEGWNIGTPLATFGPADIFDATLTLQRPSRADVPAAIVATLNHRYPRLHAATVGVTWADNVSRERRVIDGIPLAQKAMILSALEGADGWLIKGEANLVEPAAGAFVITIGGNITSQLIPLTTAQASCQSFSATLYRRWYQQVEVHYRVAIDMGGLSERDESISLAIESTFDAGAWESARPTRASAGLYQANPPPGYVQPTGYEGLPAPFPPDDTALDHHADITGGDLASAIKHVVARAVRTATAGRRQQTVSFERPFDPRFDLGDTLAVSAHGIAATGQLADFSDTLDLESGEIVTAMTLACPNGNSMATTFTATASAPGNTVAHDFTLAPLGNFVGAADDTPAVPYADGLQGFLFNVQPTADSAWPAQSTYDSGKPVYNTQFRVIMPEIPAPLRDPLEIEATITANVQIAGSGVTVTF